MTDNDHAAIEALLAVRCPPTQQGYTGIQAITYISREVGRRAQKEADGLRAEVEREKARAAKATAERDRMAGVLREMVTRWRKRSGEIPRGGYHEAQAANAAEAETLERCADALDSALAEIGGGK